MSIGIMGSKSLISLLNKDRERRSTRACAVSFQHAETPWGSIKQP